MALYLEKLRYAKDFKEAVDNKNSHKIEAVFLEWGEDGAEDSNFYFALVFLSVANDVGDFNEILDSFKKALALNPDDASLNDWYLDLASNSLIYGLDQIRYIDRELYLEYKVIVDELLF